MTTLTSTNVDPNPRANSFLAEEERWGRPSLREAAVTWWEAGLSGKPEDYARMEKAERGINQHYSNVARYREVRALLEEPGLEPRARRRLERVQRAYQGMQAPPTLLDRITTESAALQERYGTFRATFEGAQRTDNELEEVLRTTSDSARARAAWDARKQIGGLVADEVRQLAVLRNEAARAVGFEDFWHQQLALEEMEPAWLVATLEAVDKATAEPFAAMKASLDERLATRFGIRRSELRPWHYGDPFFQETPDVFASPADPLYAELDVVEIAAQTYRTLGFSNIDAILARSDLYPREGKNQHAYASDMDREGDVRTFLNVQRNARWMGTLLHEFGHAIYMDGIDRTSLAWDLRDDPQGFLNEGLAMFCEQPMFEPTWLSELVGLSAEEAERIAPRLARQEMSTLLAFVRWCLTIVNFERAFYADPTRDLNSLWWDLVERYQRVSRPDRRDEPDWATKIHVATAPVYYQKYLLGRLFSTQLTERMNEEFGGWWQGRLRAGAYVKQNLFAPGATYPWPELVERVTGQPLGVAALARAVAWTGEGARHPE